MKFSEMIQGAMNWMINPGYKVSHTTGAKQNQPVTVVAVPALNTPDGNPPERFPDQPKTVQFGKTGIQRFGGRLAEDYLPQMQGREGVLKFDEMYRSDPQVYSAIKRGNMKLKSAKFFIEATDKNDPAEVELAEKVSYCMFEGMDKIWLDNMNDLLTFRRYGFTVLEPTWKSIDHPGWGTMWTLASLGWISPKTLWQWWVVGNKLWAVRQISYGDDYSYIDIPGIHKVKSEKDVPADAVACDELLILTEDMEGNNFEGISNLRPMYKPYFLKDMMQKTNGLGIENNARGLWVLKIPQNQINTKQAEKAIAALNNLAQGDVPGMAIPQGWELTYQQSNYQADETMKAISAEDAAISKVTQTDQMEMGFTTTGSRAAHDSKESSEETALKNIAQYLCDKLQPLIKQFVDYNDPKKGRIKYPKMKFTGVDSKPSLEDAQKLQTLQVGGFIDPNNPVVRAYVHEHFDIPGGDDIEEAQDTPDGTDPKGPKGGEDPKEVKKEEQEHGSLIKQIEADTKAGKPKPTEEYAKEIVDAHDKKATTMSEASAKSYRETFDEFYAEYNQLLTNSIENYILKKYLSQLEEALNSSTPDKKVVNIQLGYRTKLNQLISDFIEKAVREGRSQAYDELKKPVSFAAKKKTLPEGLYGWVKARADFNTKSQLDNLSKKLTAAVLTALNNNKSKESVLFDAKEAGEDYLSNINNTGEGIVTVEAINEGRFSMFMENSDDILGFTFDATLENSCPLCRSLHGKSFKVDDPESIEMTPPLHPLCECILIPIMKGEEPPEWTRLKADPDITEKYKKLGECGHAH